MTKMIGSTTRAAFSAVPVKIIERLSSECTDFARIMLPGMSPNASTTAQLKRGALKIYSSCGDGFAAHADE